MKFPKLIAAIGVLFLPLGSCDPEGPSLENYKAKNVILFIGDGMGISTVTAGRIYAGQKLGQTGEEYVLPFENFKHVALVKTYNTDAQVPDSAGNATAIHSGVKTKIGVLGVGPGVIKGDCKSGLANPLPLLGEQVKTRGLALGIVSTARLTHATPASVYARSASRDWEAYVSDQTEDGVLCEDIATQLLRSRFDVALGGGWAPFLGESFGGVRREKSMDLTAEWVARTNGTYVSNRIEMQEAPKDVPLLGLFSISHMDFMADPGRDQDQPTLTQMTAEAINRLENNPNGYYLMVEGGRIDHGHHAGRAGYALEEMVEFANSIQFAIDNTDPEETLILVTADHSHVFSIGGYPRRGNDILGLVIPPSEIEGFDEPSKAEDGKPFTTLSYSNGPGSIASMTHRPYPEIGLYAQQQSAIPLSGETHSGEDVALYGNGPGAHRISGVIEQNLIYNIIVGAFGWE